MKRGTYGTINFYEKIRGCLCRIIREHDADLYYVQFLCPCARKLDLATPMHGNYLKYRFTPLKP